MNARSQIWVPFISMARALAYSFCVAFLFLVDLRFCPAPAEVFFDNWTMTGGISDFDNQVSYGISVGQSKELYNLGDCTEANIVRKTETGLPFKFRNGASGTPTSAS